MFDHNETDLLKEILRELRTTNDKLTDENTLLRFVAAETLASKQILQTIADNTVPPPKRLSTTAKISFNGVIMANNALALNVGQTSTIAPITFLADGTTPSGATYSAATYTFTDPSATIVLNSDGVTGVVTGVAAGSASGSVSFTATDTDGAVSQWNVPFTITTSSVTPPPPEQLSQSAGVTFTTPV